MSDNAFEDIAKCIDCQRVIGQIATNLPGEMRRHQIAQMARLERCGDCAVRRLTAAPGEERMANG